MAAVAPKEQREIIRLILDKHKTLVAGDAYCLVSARWYNLWKDYVDFDATSATVGGSSAVEPPHVDNADLFADEHPPGTLKTTLLEGQDYVLLPEEAWEQLLKWYSGGPTVKRFVIEEGESKFKRVEVFLFNLKLLLASGTAPNAPVDLAISRQATLAQVRTFACEKWKLTEPAKLRVWNADELLQDSALTKSLEDLRLIDGQKLHFELGGSGSGSSTAASSPVSSSPSSSAHNVTAPGKKASSIGGSLANIFSGLFGSRHSHSRRHSNSGNSASSVSHSLSPSSSSSSSDASHSPAESTAFTNSSGVLRGVTGLENLGNTCFMNAALQALTHTKPLVQFFLTDQYQKQINRRNPLGMKGQLAEHYGALLKELWSGKYASVAPRDLKWILGKFAPQFNGYAQHDSQELLAFLLDGLHEDLNRIATKPYVEVRDSDGQQSDADVAAEHWRLHMMRNSSVVVDLFQGQLKSTIRCPECQKISITFDPFMFLSLPLPIDTSRTLELVVSRLNRSKMAARYSFKLPKTARIGELKAAIAAATQTRADQWEVCDIYQCKVYSAFGDARSISAIPSHDVAIFAFEKPADYDPKLHVEVQVLHRTDLPTVGGGTPDDFGGLLFSRPPMRLFGYPFYVYVRRDVSGRQLYHTVWQAIRRYIHHDPAEVPPDPPSNTTAHVPAPSTSSTVSPSSQLSSSASSDTDEADPLYIPSSSSRYNTGTVPYPFRLHRVNQSGIGCGVCPLLSRSCTGCEIQLGDRPLGVRSDTIQLAVHLPPRQVDKRYVVSEAESVLLDESTTRNRAAAAEAARAGHGVSLFDCLKCFTVNERLGPNDLWYCPRCKTHRQAFKKFDLWRTPEVLVVHLKRFFQYTAAYREKLTTFVDFPVLNLDLTPFIIRHNGNGNNGSNGSSHDASGDSTVSSAPLDDAVYDLFAVINHMGGLGGGHYVSVAKNHEDKCWYYFNDSSARYLGPNDHPATRQALRTEQAYVLFYQRRGTAPANGTAAVNGVNGAVTPPQSKQ